MQEAVKEMYLAYLIQHYPGDFVVQILSSRTIDGTHYTIEARTADDGVKYYTITQEAVNAWLFRLHPYRQRHEGHG
jgi:hypothetical protein